MRPADTPQPGPKWVFDVNVWVSALISPHGAPARIVRAVLDGELTREFVRQLATRADMQPDGRPSHHTRDPDDDYLVALAELPDVVGIVTGDEDLLADERLQRLPGITLRTPRDMAAALAGPGVIPVQRDE